MRALITISSILLMLATASAQDCEVRFQKLLSKLKDDHRRLDHSMFGTHQLITVNYANGTVSKELIKNMSSGSRTIMEGEHFKIYEDQFDRVIIYPYDSLLTIYERPKGSESREFELWEEELKVISSTGSSIKCETKHSLKGNLLKVVYDLPKADKTNMIKTITVMLEEGSGHPHEVMIELYPGAQMVSKKIEFVKYEFGKVDERLDLPSAKLAERELRRGNPLFGFELRDMRQNTTGHDHP